MPFGSLDLPRSRAEAVERARHVLDVRRCARCGHVFQARFDQARLDRQAELASATGLAWNRGRRWRRWQDELAREWVERYMMTGRTVALVRPGDGSFARRLERLGCRVVAFEPGRGPRTDSARSRARGLDVRPGPFGRAEVGELEPDAIVCRYVLQSLPDPAGYLRELRRGAVEGRIPLHLLAEVPRADKALEKRRFNDFACERASYFTEQSLRVLFEGAGWGVVDLHDGFGGEVVTIAAVPRVRGECRTTWLDRAGLAEAAAELRADFADQVRHVHAALADWRAANKTVALWGAAGKAAVLINMCGLGRDVAPLVVDSDPRKHGAFVPGTGQRIESPEACRRDGVDVILICTPWRARDIEYEIRRVRGLDCELWVPHDGRIVPLTRRLEL